MKFLKLIAAFIFLSQNANSKGVSLAKDFRTYAEKSMKEISLVMESSNDSRFFMTKTKAINIPNLNSNRAKRSVFRKAPYLLYPGKNDQMLIVWQLNITEECSFLWSSDSTIAFKNIYSTECSTDHLHKVLLTHLESNTKYYYQVVVDSFQIEKGSFITGALSNSKKISFYAYGDTRTYPKKHDLVAERILASIAADPESQTFVISTGDFVSNGNKESKWDEQFFNPKYSSIQKMLANLPYVGAMGNHEGQGKLFSKYFPYPIFESNRYYFSYDYGPVHFTVVDQFTDYAEGSVQYKWLKNDLAKSHKSWKIILLHKPGWSAEGGHSNNLEVQKVIQPLCIEYGVQFVISGHNHYYSRAIANGVQHITTGGGGAPLYNPDSKADSIMLVDKSYHFCKLTIDHDTLHFSAIRSDGSVIESFYCYLNKSLKNSKSDDFFCRRILISSKGKSLKIVNQLDTVGSLRIFDKNEKLIYSGKLNPKINRIKFKTIGQYDIVIIIDKKYFKKRIVIE